MDDMRGLIRNFVVENFVLDSESETFSDEIDLRKAGILDSLSILKLIKFIEGQFAIELRAEDVEAGGVLSVSSIERLVQSRKL